jgi:hypothetical protein
MIRSSILEPRFNVDFPYETFPWRLEVNKDHHNVKGIALTVCHFECEEHLQKYLDRYKLKPKDYEVTNRDGKSLKSSKKHKTNVSKILLPPSITKFLKMRQDVDSGSRKIHIRQCNRFG